eukprot:CAMPEP_0170620046 /NCGR_PEP_ID=MMETSP0224-20130122/27850_1 /TAXON_ID=285029 /ORGANISM="Togula jolla, Strain CCCM 725" /LENGTH=275 /DNA_ID=CAMNT_0010946195 /DNA_START=47 /DNA_END=874 /DNA_ORIENTATION=-
MAMLLALALLAGVSAQSPDQLSELKSTDPGGYSIMEDLLEKEAESESAAQSAAAASAGRAKSLLRKTARTVEHKKAQKAGLQLPKAMASWLSGKDSHAKFSTKWAVASPAVPKSTSTSSYLAELNPGPARKAPAAAVAPSEIAKPAGGAHASNVSVKPQPVATAAADDIVALWSQRKGAPAKAVESNLEVRSRSAEHKTSDAAGVQRTVSNGYLASVGWEVPADMQASKINPYLDHLGPPRVAPAASAEKERSSGNSYLDSLMPSGYLGLEPLKA